MDRILSKFLLIVSLSIFFLVSPHLVEVEAAQPIEEFTGSVQVEDSPTPANPVVINFFYSLSCPHCAEEASFIQSLAEDNERVELRAFEISQNQANAFLLGKIGQKLGTPVGGVPFTVIGSETFIGYQDDQTTGQEIQQVVEGCLANFTQGCEDQVEPLLSNEPAPAVTPVAEPSKTDQPASTAQPIDPIDQEHKLNQELKLPFVGQVRIKDLSLPLLTFLVALLDGFNPCAMWVLVFLISLLLGMKNRRRMWLLGSAFILTSGVVYFLFLSAWLNLFLFLGFVFWVRVIVALVALGAGIYCLYDFMTNKNAACKVTQPKKRKRVFDRLKALVKKENLWAALIGIILLAVAVNMVELVCSAGLPAVFTQVLSLSNLTRWQYYAYLIFYVLIFMLDDLMVFVAAMVTLKLTGLESRYARYSRLVGGILMLIIGLLLIFKPEWLMFA